MIRFFSSVWGVASLTIGAGYAVAGVGPVEWALLGAWIGASVATWRRAERGRRV
jgi:hypothetical protein